VSLRPQRGDEVVQFIFDLGRRCHCVRDFLTQQLSVTLSQSMEGLFDRVFCHAKLCARSRLATVESGSSESNVFNRSSNGALADR